MKLLYIHQIFQKKYINSFLKKFALTSLFCFILIVNPLPSLLYTMIKQNIEFYKIQPSRFLVGFGREM